MIKIKAVPYGPRGPVDSCQCIKYGIDQTYHVEFHADRQDTSAPGWRHLLALIDEAAADGRASFAPLQEMSPEERQQIITLPTTISNLVDVTYLNLYSSNLVRLPSEIGAMTNLERFHPYTSYRLHWFPYEITRCTRLRETSLSTRTLYGNFKIRPPFPRLWHPPPARRVDGGDLNPALWGATRSESCSICGEPIGATGPLQAWVSLWVATDIMPLLVNACSRLCLERVPLDTPDLEALHARYGYDRAP